MSDTEMDELALLWTQDANPQEEQLVQRLARRVGWRARLLQHADLGAAIAMAGGIAVLVLLEGGNLSALGGLLLVLALAWATWKRHALWNLENSLAAGSSDDLLAVSAESGRARLKRTNISLVLVVPLFLLAVWFGNRLEESTASADPVALVAADPVKAVLWLGFIAALVLYLCRSRRAILSELRTIEALRGEYAEEDRLDAS